MSTKLVRVSLAALTRVEYTEIIEVPADMTESELNCLLDQRYDDVDGGEYTDDCHYWERSESCNVVVLGADDPGTANFTLQRDDDGSFIVEKV